ncbi:5-oxoprolinase subunit PxpB [Pseudoalteromonas sp.]|uniref:5-oxoprolinase subunit PxpB n=1 Tax=Pseudoalteromonas sp. TaxID=53249 RepID=UPI003561C00A
MDMLPLVYALSNTRLLIDATHINAGNVLATQKKIWALAAHCTTSNEFIDVVPGMNSLTLYLRSSAQLTHWQRTLPALWADIKSSDFSGNHHVINTHYNGADLLSLAQFHNLTVQEVINIHCATQYHVLFLGFQPGFAYLHGLDPRLHTPRRAEPRIKVPKGAVAIGAAQTGIYPADTPGGWHIIGHSDTELFNSNNTPACLLQPGDTLAFVATHTQELAND